MQKTTLVMVLLFCLSLVGLAVADQHESSGKAVYEKACGSCHNSGIAGAPKLGDQDAWAPRLDQGSEALYDSAINGKGTMPAKGGQAGLSDAEVKAAVDYMIDQSR